MLIATPAWNSGGSNWKITSCVPEGTRTALKKWSAWCTWLTFPSMMALQPGYHESVSNSHPGWGMSTMAWTVSTRSLMIRADPHRGPGKDESPGAST